MAGNMSIFFVGEPEKTGAPDPLRESMRSLLFMFYSTMTELKRGGRAAQSRKGNSAAAGTRKNQPIGCD